MATERLLDFLPPQWRHKLIWQGFCSWGSLFVGCLIALPAWAEPELRVAIRNGVDQVSLGSSTLAVIRDSAGQAIAQLPQGRALVAETERGRVNLADRQGRAFWIEPTADGYVFIGDSWYRGRILVLFSEGGLVAINYVDLEQYLYSVLGGEMPTSWPLEAIQAQAVAARSYALYKRQRAASALYDVESDTTWQIYPGLKSETQSTHTAVETTRGQVLTYNGQIIEAVFHSSSGGHTENVEDVWSQPLPYLRGVRDFDQGAPIYQWVATFSMEEFQSRIPGIGGLISAVPERTTPQGRIITIRLTGEAGSRVLSGDEIRRALNLRSTLFSINLVGMNTIQIIGRGYGHGIGMSQWGAHNLAARGHTYQQILAHYYQGTTLAVVQVQ
ncbi:MAG: SpoIID/LytB domain-containing protein [Pseudanabaenales cyanobacterium]|nr:SpoIID/LytB domain-containing protein [Pseudanabaenales cyanobacterium]